MWSEQFELRFVSSAVNASCRARWHPHQPVWARLVAALSLVTHSEKYARTVVALKRTQRWRPHQMTDISISTSWYVATCTIKPQWLWIQLLISCVYAAKRSGVSAQRESVARRTPAASEALVRILSFVFEYNGQDLMLSRLQRLCWCQLPRRSDRYC